MVFCSFKAMNPVAAIALVLACAVVSSATITAHSTTKPATAKATAGVKATSKTSSKSVTHSTSHPATASGRYQGKRGSGVHYAASGGSHLQAAPSPERYVEVQKALADRGFFKGEVNGTWGPDSVDALQQFQTSQNLPDDGKISSLTLIGLGLGPPHAYPGGVVPGNQTSGATAASGPIPMSPPTNAPPTGVTPGQTPQPHASPNQPAAIPAPTVTPGNPPSAPKPHQQ